MISVLGKISRNGVRAEEVSIGFSLHKVNALARPNLFGLTQDH